MPGLKTRQDGRQAAEQHGPGKADGQAAGHALANIFGQAGRLRGLRQQGSGGRHKGQPGSGQLHRLAVAREQARAHRGFQLLQVQRQRRLRDGQPARGPAKVQFFGQHQKVAKVAEFHGYEKCIVESIIGIRQLFMAAQQSRLHFLHLFGDSTWPRNSTGKTPSS